MYTIMHQLAEVKRMLLQYAGPSTALDLHMSVLAFFSSTPEYRNEPDKYLVWLRRYLGYLNELMYLAR
jgi:hypothetical protein